jgi:hypothetical protein
VDDNLELVTLSFVRRAERHAQERFGCALVDVVDIEHVMRAQNGTTSIGTDHVPTTGPYRPQAAQTSEPLAGRSGYQ